MANGMRRAYCADYSATVEREGYGVSVHGLVNRRPLITVLCIRSTLPLLLFGGLRIPPHPHLSSSWEPCCLLRMGCRKYGIGAGG